MKGKYLKIAFGIIGTIILGAIGSGVWERFLSPLLDSAASMLASLFSLISKSYADSLYSEVGKGSTSILGHFVIVPYLLIWFAIFLYPIVLTSLLFKKLKRIKSIHVVQKNETSNTQLLNDEKKSLSAAEKQKKVKPFLYLNYIIVFSFAIVILSRITKDAYTYDVVVYIEQSIEIISPYISESELKQIKSQFRQIDNRYKFQSFNSMLTQLAAKNKIILPQISVLKIE